MHNCAELVLSGRTGSYQYGATMLQPPCQKSVLGGLAAADTAGWGMDSRPGASIGVGVAFRLRT